MPKLMVIRHSIALANEEGILMGSRLDSPLSEKGVELAKKKGQELKKQHFNPTKVFTSKLTRAKQTAKIIIDELGLELELVQLTGLNERDFGEHDGKPYQSVLDAFAKYGDNPPTIERVEPFEKRVLESLNKIKQESTGYTLVVTHSNPVMVMKKAIYSPVKSNKFWDQGDPAYCEGFLYEF